MEFIDNGCTGDVFRQGDYVYKVHGSDRTYNREIKVVHKLMGLDFQHVVQYYQTDQSKTIKMDYVEYNLEGLIQDDVIDTPTMIIMSVLTCLKQLHDNSIIHGDYKAKNIMINEDGQIKVIDFDHGKLSDNMVLKMDDLDKAKILILQIIFGMSYDECHPHKKLLVNELKKTDEVLANMLESKEYNLNDLVLHYL
jgi:serine/threonine protein kinase